MGGEKGKQVDSYKGRWHLETDTESGRYHTGIFLVGYEWVKTAEHKLSGFYLSKSHFKPWPREQIALTGSVHLCLRSNEKWLKAEARVRQAGWAPH